MQTDLSCIHCGYNLRGLDETGKCPECGTAIADSLRGDLLEFADPDWLDKIKLGVIVRFWHLPLSIIALPLTIVFPATADVLTWLVADAAGLGASLLITTREPRMEFREGVFTLRRVVRFAAAAGFAGAMLGIAHSAYTALPTYSHVIAICLGLLRWAAVWGEVAYLGRLASRIPDRRLGESAQTVLWLALILGVFAAVTALVALEGVGLILVVLGPPFFIGCLLLLAAYRKALRQAAAKARVTLAADSHQPAAPVNPPLPDNTSCH